MKTVVTHVVVLMRQGDSTSQRALPLAEFAKLLEPVTETDGTFERRVLSVVGEGALDPKATPMPSKAGETWAKGFRAGEDQAAETLGEAGHHEAAMHLRATFAKERALEAPTWCSACGALNDGTWKVPAAAARGSSAAIWTATEYERVQRSRDEALAEVMRLKEEHLAMAERLSQRASEAARLGDQLVDARRTNDQHCTERDALETALKAIARSKPSYADTIAENALSDLKARQMTFALECKRREEAILARKEQG